MCEVFNQKKPRGELLTSWLLNGITDAVFQAATLKTDPNFDQALRFSLKACMLPTQKKNEVKEASFEKINRAIKHSFRLASQGINHGTNTAILSCWQMAHYSIQLHGKCAAWSGSKLISHCLGKCCSLLFTRLICF